MHFTELMAMLTEQANKYRDNFPKQNMGAAYSLGPGRIFMTSTEYAEQAGGFYCSVCLTAEGMVSDTQAGVGLSFVIKPATSLQGTKCILGG